MTPAPTTPAKKQITNLRQRQSLLYLMLFSLATVLIWVVISLITSQKKTGISPELQKLAVPLTPTLNQETLRRVEQKAFYSESQLSQFPIYKIIVAPNGVDESIVTIDTAVETLFPSPQPSASPTPNPTPTESPLTVGQSQATTSAQTSVSTSSATTN